MSTERIRNKFLWIPRRLDGRLRWLTRVKVVEAYTARACPDYSGGGYMLWGWHEVPAIDRSKKLTGESQVRVA